MKKGATTPLIRSAQVRSIDDDSRRIEAVASTEAVDSYGTRLMANWDLERFNANPVLLFAHNDQMLPVGTCENVRLEGKTLVFEAVFDDSTEFDRQVFEKYRRGVLRGFSVRFNPLERRVIDEGGKQVVEYSRSELMEISCVPVPANPEALRRSAGGARGHTMKKADMMKALRAMMDGDGGDDEKKAAAELYEKMGGDDAMKAAEGEEGGDEGRAEGEDDKEPESEKGKEDEEPKSERAPAPARAPAPQQAKSRSAGAKTIDLAVRVAELEAAEQRRAVRALVDQHKDRFTETTRAWALGESLEVVQRYIRRAPKQDLRAPATASATRGETEGKVELHTIPAEDEKKLDRMLGIRQESDQLGYGDVDPVRGVRVFNAPPPGRFRSALAGKGVK